MGKTRTALLALSLVALLPLAAPAGAQSGGGGSVWYFAEGNTLPGWYEFLVMINPDPSRAIDVIIEYQLEEPAGVAQPGRIATVSVPPGGRRTVSVFETSNGVGRTFTGVSAKLSSSAPFVAERPMYFVNQFDVGLVNGAHDALGVTSPANEWYFAEGSTLFADGLGFQPYFTMQNTSGSSATVDIEYYTNNPDSVVMRRITVPDAARITTDVTNPLDNPAYPGSLGPGYEGFGTIVRSSRPIIVERPFYANREFPGIGSVSGATDERGATDASATEAFFAEGTVLPEFFEFLTVFNPNLTEAVLSVDYQVEGSTVPVAKQLRVGPKARRTVQVYNPADEAGLGRDGPNASAPGSAGVSVHLRSTNGVGFVAERPLFFARDFGNGVVDGAHDALGALAPAPEWLFAEGTVRPGFFAFLTIQNPSPTATVARLEYFVDQGPIVTRTREVPANSRVTVNVSDPNSPGSPQLGPDADFGVRVVSDRADLPLVVERPLYVNASIAGSTEVFNGGHNTLGHVVPAAPAAALALTKTDQPDPVAPESELTYTLSVTNVSAVTATGVEIVDTLPSGVTFVRASGGATPVGGTVIFSMGDLTPGVSASSTLVVTPASEGTVTNNAQGMADNAATVTATATTSVVASAAPAPALHMSDGRTWAFLLDQSGDVANQSDVVTTVLRVGNGIVGQAGYTMSTAAAPAGLLAGTATTLPAAGCDDCSIEVAMPFVMPFFGINYTTATVSSNGYVEFGQPAHDTFDDFAPNAGEVGDYYRAAMPYWGDLAVGPGDFITTTISPDGQSFAVQWEVNQSDVPNPGPPERVFQVVFSTDGRIRYDYVGPNTLGGIDALVALSGGTGPASYFEVARDTLNVPATSLFFTPTAVAAGPSAAGTLTTTVPAGSLAEPVPFASASPGCSETTTASIGQEGVVTCPVPTLAPGAQAEFFVRYRVPSESDILTSALYRIGTTVVADREQLPLASH